MNGKRERFASKGFNRCKLLFVCLNRLIIYFLSNLNTHLFCHVG